MSKTLQELEALLKNQASLPPVDQWDPDLSGDIDIVIRSDGHWYHEGDQIKRQELVNLFASILRREGDGEYYLLTPVEKWRIQVEECPLQIVDLEVSSDSPPKILLKTNTEQWYVLSEDHPLTVEQAQGEPKPVVMTQRGLCAKVNRPCFYRLVELAAQRDDELVLETDRGAFSLGQI